MSNVRKERDRERNECNEAELEKYERIRSAWENRKSLDHAPVNGVEGSKLEFAWSKRQSGLHLGVSKIESDGGGDVVSDGDAEVRCRSVVWAGSAPGPTSPDPPSGPINRRLPFWFWN